MKTLCEEVREYFVENGIPVDEIDEEEDIDEEETEEDKIEEETIDEILEMPGDELVRNIPSDGPLEMPEEYQPAPRTKRVPDVQPHGGTTDDLEILQDPEFYE